MPRVLRPGGGGGKMRVCYTARRKRGLVATSMHMITEGMTLRAAAADNAMLEMKGEGNIIRNAWKRHDYEWFVDNTREQDVGTNDNGVEGAI